MVFLALIPAVVLAGALVYVLREQTRERTAFLRAVELAIGEGSKDREGSRQIIAELTEKIQHPEIPHPVPTPYEPGPEPEVDPAFEQAGKIYPVAPADDNGTP